MGNYVACGLNGDVAVKEPKTAAVIFPSGEVRRLEWTATAAELMVELPGHFVACAREMNDGRKILPLSADEELEPGEIYVMLPMQPVNVAMDESTPVFLRRLSVCRSKKPSLETIVEDSVVSSR